MPSKPVSKIRLSVTIAGILVSTAVVFFLVTAVSSTEVEISLFTRHLQFISERSIRMASGLTLRELRFEGFRDIDFELPQRSAIVMPPFRSTAARALSAISLTVKGEESKRMVLSQTRGGEFQLVEAAGGEDRGQITFRPGGIPAGQVITVSAYVRGSYSIVYPQPLGDDGLGSLARPDLDLDGEIDVSDPNIGIVTYDDEPVRLLPSAGSKATFVLRDGRRPEVLLSQVPADLKSFTSVASSEVSWVEGGKITFREVNNRELQVQPGDRLHFEKLGGLIRELTLKDGILHLSFIGVAKGLRSDLIGQNRSLMPSRLRWLASQEDPLLAVTVIVYLVGLAAAIASFFWKSSK